MLEEFAGSGAYRTLIEYFTRPETHLAVLWPGLLSFAILHFYIRAGKLSARLLAIWLLALPVTYLCARWEITPETRQLFIFSVFSVICVLLLFQRVYVPPALAYALTFFSLWLVDVSHALNLALDGSVALTDFYLGVGGAGLRDALFLMPLITACAAAYAVARVRSRGETLAEI